MKAVYYYETSGNNTHAAQCSIPEDPNSKRQAVFISFTENSFKKAGKIVCYLHKFQSIPFYIEDALRKKTTVTKKYN